ncbi:MAG: TetR/AcrR family transcriptional regulator [Myxococcales bacterium]|nr:TetR/AcrR family transcriptional regulator [Myxococcales bacterium]
MDSAEQIREAATHLFACHGYDGASLAAIAERVGVTKQTLLYHYPSKDVLRRAVLDGVFAHFRERLPQMLEAVTSGHGRFEALTRELLDFFEADHARAILMVRELMDNPELMQKLLSENLRPWILLVAQYIREGQRGGLIYEDVDPEAYVLNVILMVLSSISARPIAESLLGAEPLCREDRPSRQLDELMRMTRMSLFKR